MAHPADVPPGPLPEAAVPAPGLAAAMSIGEVLDLLRREFPDISVSKIRFLDAEGIVAPARTSSGYRRFTNDDVDRLQWVLRVQRDHYLPLRVIKQYLDAADPADRPRQIPPPTARDGPAATADPAAPTAPTAAPGPGARAGTGGAAPPQPGAARTPRTRRLHRDELPDATGITPQALVEMESFGLVRARSGWYDPDDVAVATAVARLAAYGLAPRHLRGVRSAADREVGLLEQVLAPQLRHRRPDARARADQTAAEIRELTRRVQDAIVSGALRDLGLDPR